MKYKAYKLSFPCGVHFGENSLDSSETLFHSDSMFSALCTEASREGNDSVKSVSYTHLTLPTNSLV